MPLMTIQLTTAKQKVRTIVSVGPMMPVGYTTSVRLPPLWGLGGVSLEFEAGSHIVSRPRNLVAPDMLVINIPPQRVQSACRVWLDNHENSVLLARYMLTGLTAICRAQGWECIVLPLLEEAGDGPY